MCLSFSDVIQLCRTVAQFQFLIDRVHGNMVLSTPIIANSVKLTDSKSPAERIC